MSGAIRIRQAWRRPMAGRLGTTALAMLDGLASEASQAVPRGSPVPNQLHRPLTGLSPSTTAGSSIPAAAGLCDRASRPGTVGLIETRLGHPNAPRAARFSTRPPSIPSDVAWKIGERARQRQQGRVWTFVIGGTAVAGFAIAALNTFQENLMFYITPTQAMEQYRNDPGKSRFRLGGLVLDGSVRKFTNSTEMEFVVTDLETDILVKYRGALPDLFREGHSVVAEGFLRPMPASEADAAGANPGICHAASGEEDLSSGVRDVSKKARGMSVMFAAMEVLAKHDEKYMPQEVAQAIAKNKTKQEEEEARLKEASGVVPAAAVFNDQAGPNQWKPAGGRVKRDAVGRTPVESQTYEVTS